MDLLLLQLTLTIEVLGILLAAVLAVVVPEKLTNRLRDIGGALSSFAKLDRRCYAALTVGTLAVCVLLAAIRFPTPVFHDEFAYLLSADTFASGRLTNPTHPHWQHFETFHVIHQPTYQGKYPPAQSMLLALGQVIWQPIVGVWISAVMMCAATYWMLRAFVPSPWALLGGAIPILRFGVLLPATGYGPFYWIASYWGGMAAACGAALLVGGAARTNDRPSVVAGLAVGAGLAILANSRPFEGLVLAVPVMMWMLFHVFARGWRERLGAITAMLGVLLATGAAMCAYNIAVTGDVLTMPYAMHERTYNSLSFFSWQEKGATKEYRHWVMERFYEDPVKGTAAKAIADARASLPRFAAIKSLQLFGFAAGPTFLITILSLSAACRNRVFQLTSVLLCLQWLGMVPCLWFLPHYAAPLSTTIILAEVILLQKLAEYRVAGRQAGIVLVTAVLVISILSFAVGIARYSLQHSEVVERREAVISSLESLGGLHLVLVRYDLEHHNPDAEWVYNRANIDCQDLVWARDMGDGQNVGLIRHFQGRRIWLLEPDCDPLRLQPIDATGTENPF